MNWKVFLKNIVALFLSHIPGRVNGVCVLTYHSVGDNHLFFNVSLNDFAEQMAYLHHHGYEVISLGQLEELLNKRKIKKKVVVLTFDDGFYNNYTNVFPLLVKYGFQATVFLATGHIGKEILIRDFPMKFMSIDNIREMFSSGLVDFQAHTHNHVKLPKYSEEVAREEILKSRDEVEKILDKKCLYFAYPYGQHSGPLQEILKENNFRLAFTTQKGFVNFDSNRLSLPRYSVDSYTNKARFISILRHGL